MGAEDNGVSAPSDGEGGDRQGSEPVSHRLSEIQDLIAELVGALGSIVLFCDDPRGSESGETLASGMARLLPAARAALASAKARGEP